MWNPEPALGGNSFTCMASQRLPNYLLTYRKQAALSQEEVAYLLGSQSGSKVSRYELFIREPGLQTTLAYEAIFQRPVSELFPGVFEKIQNAVRARAKKLEQKGFRGKANGFNTRKRQTLSAILSGGSEKQTHQS